MPLEQRKARRREQNRLAAQRCRQRKKVVNVDIEEVGIYINNMRDSGVEANIFLFYFF